MILLQSRRRLRLGWAASSHTCFRGYSQSNDRVLSARITYLQRRFKFQYPLDLLTTNRTESATTIPDCHRARLAHASVSTWKQHDARSILAADLAACDIFISSFCLRCIPNRLRVNGLLGCTDEQFRFVQCALHALHTVLLIWNGLPIFHFVLTIRFG